MCCLVMGLVCVYVRMGVCDVSVHTYARAHGAPALEAYRGSACAPASHGFGHLTSSLQSGGCSSSP